MYHVTLKTAFGWQTVELTLMSEKCKDRTVARLKREGWTEIKVNGEAV